jgi:hypothetical protein
MKSNIVYLIWNLINFCLILLIAIWVNISLYIPKQLETKIDKMEVELETYKNMHSDSIIIHIDNHINIPKSTKTTK